MLFGLPGRRGAARLLAREPQVRGGRAAGPVAQPGAPLFQGAGRRRAPLHPPPRRVLWRVAARRARRPGARRARRGCDAALMTLLAGVVDTSRRVADTSSRLAKVAALAACLRSLAPEASTAGRR